MSRSLQLQSTWLTLRSLDNQYAEGIEHLKANSDTTAGQEGTLGTGTTNSGDGEGVSGSTLGSGSGLQQQNSQGGMVDTVKSYLGYGSTGSGTTTGVPEGGPRGLETSHVGESTALPGQGNTYLKYGPGSTGPGAADVGSTGLGSGATGLGSETSGLGAGTTSVGGGSGVGDVAPRSTIGTTDTTTGSSLGESTTLGGADTARDSTTSSNPVSSTVESAKESVTDTTNKDDDRKVTSGADDHKPPAPADGKPHTLENPTSIPTAGGERLGEKHWGESGIVPDNPPPRASEAGISSAEGQSTRE